MTHVWRSLRRRLRRAARRLLLPLIGRPITCAACGRELSRGRAVIVSGRVRVIGLLETNVRVAFEDKETLQFRHLELDRCPSPDRPWVR